MKHRLHVVGLPYLPVSRRFPACAFTARAEKFCNIMHGLGHEVLLYGVGDCDASCSRFITTIDADERRRWYGKYDDTKVGYAEKPIQWEPIAEAWHESNVSAAYWVRKNLQQGDFVCIIGGACQKGIVDTLKDKQHLFQAVEYGIGYLGTFAQRRAFDSYAHMHYVYGRESPHLPNHRDGENFDAVIPCPYRTEQFSLSPSPSDYCLFVGRIARRKGLRAAVEATRRAGRKLVIAGQGVAKVDGPRIYADDGEMYEGSHLEYVGYADQVTKINLMRNARCVLAPSEYIEPFGGVNVEAQLCGTPAITTDFGAFPETVEHGVSGYRCRTLEQFEWAIEAVPYLNRQRIADRAASLWSMERVGRMYQEWFDMLATLWNKGWYETKDRSQLDWLTPMEIDR